MSETNPYVGIAALAFVAVMFGVGLTGGYYTYGSLSDAESGQVVVGAATNVPASTTNAPATSAGATEQPTTAGPQSPGATTARPGTGDNPCGAPVRCGDQALVATDGLPQAAAARDGYG